MESINRDRAVLDADLATSLRPLPPISSDHLVRWIQLYLTTIRFASRRSTGHVYTLGTRISFSYRSGFLLLCFTIFRDSFYDFSYENGRTIFLLAFQLDKDILLESYIYDITN